MKALALVLLVGCSSYRAAFVTSSALIACDYGQTIYASHGGRWDRVSPSGTAVHEMNPLLGKTPSPELLTGVVLTDLAINAIVYAAPLPSWFKAAWFGAVGATETYVVAGNAHISGVCGLGYTRE